MANEKRPIAYIRPVLVVEDDLELAEMLREVLTLENCSVDIATNGREALERLPTLSYDAIICDLMMPQVDGKTFYEEVCRRYPYLADRFIFMTGKASYQSGMADFVVRTGNALLVKPFDIEELQRALQELFARG